MFKYVRDSKSNIVLEGVCEQLDTAELLVVALPLLNRSEEAIGLLFIANISVEGQQSFSEDWLGFMTLLSRFSAVTLQSRQLIHKQKELMQSFIKLIAGAIDAKSPYTGGHCQRVPELTKMLAIAACESQDEKFRDFTLTEDQWEELHFASWLHDCGKVTTPEYVVDKSTKLETIHDRIHEVRMRFEVLKRDREIETLKAINELKAGSKREAEQHFHQLELTLRELDEEFIFVADCNVGGEFMSQEKIERLHKIAERTWQRTLDDRSGISWEELLRKKKQPAKTLPVTEKLLDNKVEHLIEFDAQDVMPTDNRWGFKLQQPKYKYDRGELSNLSVKRGTLTEEERYKINDHIVQTIIMLENLPYPKHLRKVPEIAGGHHEKMDGTGYPRRLKKEDMPLTARMMAIADIFEALTAADRPYKKPKKLSESLKIMGFMRKDQHIDADLFELFLTSGAYSQYANEYLLKEQIDSVDIQDYL
ncbi:MAG: hypothetical protein COC04_06315 [Gammaproteobacteria bacterium]|nr:MAG: hypothetical protein COC04_06315 [Gammaproteobacteria bacterium]